jgi:hypothetical protein
VSRDEYLLKVYTNKKVLSVHALQYFCCLVDEKIKFKVLACAFELPNNFENSSSSPVQRPQSGILTLKMLTGSRL